MKPISRAELGQGIRATMGTKAAQTYRPARVLPASRRGHIRRLAAAGAGRRAAERQLQAWYATLRTAMGRW